MKNFHPWPGLSLLLFGIAAGSLSAGDSAVESAPVPEPSIALLGGLCGVIFLLWRKK